MTLLELWDAKDRFEDCESTLLSSKAERGLLVKVILSGASRALARRMSLAVHTSSGPTPRDPEEECM